MLNAKQLMDLVSRLFPSVDFRHGYIGNFERWGDNRSWKLFTNIEEESMLGGRRVSISLSNGSQYDGDEVIRVLNQLGFVIDDEVSQELARVKTFLRLAECA